MHHVGVDPAVVVVNEHRVSCDLPACRKPAHGGGGGDSHVNSQVSNQVRGCLRCGGGGRGITVHILISVIVGVGL